MFTEKHFGIIESAPSLSNKISANLKNIGLISFDIDAVIQQTWIYGINYASHAVGKAVNHSDLITYWELMNIALSCGYDKEKALQFAKHAWNREEVYQNAPVNPGGKFILNLFRDLGIPHVFISSRLTEFIDVTKSWFGKNFPWIDSSRIILGREHGTTGGEFKSAKIKELGGVLHFEDALEEAVIIVENSHAKVMLVSQPWNHDENIENKRIKKLDSDKQGLWPAITFLANSEFKDFLCVAQY